MFRLGRLAFLKRDQRRAAGAAFGKGLETNVRTVLITGANRGIGLTLAQRYLELGDKVIAGVRKPAEAEALRNLDGGDRLRILELDIASTSSILSAAGQLGGEALDILINNAAATAEPRDEWSTAIDPDKWLHAFRVNVLGAVEMTQAFRQNLKVARGKAVAISSGLGSIALAFETSHQAKGLYAYRVSKAALNMAMRLLSIELRQDGITVAVICPGWVRTHAPLASASPEESADGIISTIEGLVPYRPGVFKDYRNEYVPW